VVQLSGSEASIRTAYEMLRSLKDQCAHRSVSLLVTAADPVHARRVHSNLFQAASRYLALSVRSIVAQEVRHV
jgi:glycerol-3-phosphate dehydrogenase